MVVSIGVGGISPFPYPGQDGLYLEWRKNLPLTLFIYLDNITDYEVKGVKSGLQFALTYLRGIIFLVVQTRENKPPIGFPWSEATYLIHLLPEEEHPEIPVEITDESRQTLNVYLIDSASNIIKAIKHCTFSPEFTQKFHQTIREQLLSPLRDEHEYAKTLSRIQQKYLSDQLARMNIASCNSGD